MLKILFDHWIHSLSIFTAKRLTTIICQAFKKYFLAIKSIGFKICWLCFIDITLFIIFGSFLFKAFGAEKPSSTTPQFIMLIALIIEVNWFILKSALFLFLRKKDSFDALVYFRQYFFAYLQLLFFIYFIIFIGFLIIVSMGITQIPQAPWILIAAISILKIIITFFWLDSTMQLNDIVYAIERATNFFVYNLPVILLLLPIIWGLDLGIKCLFVGWHHAFSSEFILFGSKLEQLIKIFSPTTNTIKLLCLHYLILFIEIFVSSILFIIYEQKKNIQYSVSYFDQQTNNE